MDHNVGIPGWGKGIARNPFPTVRFAAPCGGPAGRASKNAVRFDPPAT
jgi:hypothetical protein